MNDKINEAMDQIGNVHLLDAMQYRRRRPYWIYILAAILVIGILLLTYMDAKGRDEPVGTTGCEARAACHCSERRSQHPYKLL